jgi:sec-independent protein translocase protein TatA
MFKGMNHSLLLFLNIGGGEILVILLAVFLLFGPSKMTEMAKKIGKAVHDLRKATDEMSREIRNETDPIKREFDVTQQKINKKEAGPVHNATGDKPGDTGNTSSDNTGTGDNVAK